MRNRDKTGTHFIFLPRNADVVPGRYTYLASCLISEQRIQLKNAETPFCNYERSVVTFLAQNDETLKDIITINR